MLGAGCTKCRARYAIEHQHPGEHQRCTEDHRSRVAQLLSARLHQALLDAVRLSRAASRSAGLATSPCVSHPSTTSVFHHSLWLDPPQPIGSAVCVSPFSGRVPFQVPAESRHRSVRGKFPCPRCAAPA